MLSAKNKVLIGISADELLKKKAYAEYMEPFEVREQRVRDFCSEINPKIKIDIFDLHDPVGIAGTDTDIQALILTREVEKGG